MNKVCTTIVGILISLNIFAQSPEKISYQAVLRNSENILVANQQLGMQISILQGADVNSAISVYSETQRPTTNINGLVTIQIGNGTTSDDFSTIDWGNGIFFIKTETDLAGGTDYTISGVSQLLSVPFALYAKTAENITGAIKETDPLFSSSIASSITSIDTANWNKNNNKGMGNWSAKDVDVLYQAESDGFICVVSNETNQCSNHIAHLYTGSTADNIQEFYSKNSDMKFVFPIQEGMYYKIIVTVGDNCTIQNPSVSIKWLPFM